MSGELEIRIERLEAAVRYLAARDQGEVFGIPGLQDMLVGKTAKDEVEAILQAVEPSDV